MKQYQGARSGSKMTPTVEYLKEVSNAPERGWENTMESVMLGFKEVAAGKIKLATENLEKRQRGGVSYEDAWNMTSIELAQAAEAHCRQFLVIKFFEAVEEIKTSPEIKTVLRQLVQLYAVHWLLNRVGDFLRVITHQRPLNFNYPHF